MIHKNRIFDSKMNSNFSSRFSKLYNPFDGARVKILDQDPFYKNKTGILSISSLHLEYLSRIIY